MDPTRQEPEVCSALTSPSSANNSRCLWGAHQDVSVPCSCGTVFAVSGSRLIVWGQPGAAI